MRRWPGGGGRYMKWPAGRARPGRGSQLPILLPSSFWIIPDLFLTLCFFYVTSDEPPGQPGPPGVEGEDPVGAAVPAELHRPSKPFAYVKPMRCEAPASTKRGQGRRGGRSQRAERGRRSRADLPRGPSLQAGPERWQGPEWQVEPGHPVEPEAWQTPSFPVTEAAMVHEDAQQGHSPTVFQPGVGPYGLPDAPGDWIFMESLASATYPCIGFNSLTGSVLFFMPTSFGTYVFEVPAFLTHIPC